MLIPILMGAAWANTGVAGNAAATMEAPAAPTTFLRILSILSPRARWTVLRKMKRGCVLHHDYQTSTIQEFYPSVYKGNY
jgi:hypothetical protein